MSEIDAVTLQVLVGGLRAACDEMGATLIRSAYSANIKERHDCSTALFDAAGELVMQAEHIPVHLGSMPDAVAAVIDLEQAPGRAWILNDPYRGGTHLPDITLISPVFYAGELLGFAACRAHHADVGGPTPGSMPAGSRTLAEEGVVIPPTPATDNELERLAAQMRFPRQRLADLRAQAAANRIGELRLVELAERHGLEELRKGMDEILAYAERRTRAALAALPDGAYTAEDVLEDDFAEPRRDVTLRVTATIDGDRLTLDFARHRLAGRRQSQLPPFGDQVGGFLRGQGADRPRRAALRRRLPADRGDRARGLSRQLAVSRRGGCRKRRDLEQNRRPGDRRARRRPAGAGSGTGDDEQPDAGERGLHLLRDARRRSGRLPGRRRAERDPRGDVQHAEHPDRGTGDRVPPAGPRAVAAPRQRRRRADIRAATGSSASWRRSRRCASR